jgi:hypothetical protein
MPVLNIPSGLWNFSHRGWRLYPSAGLGMYPSLVWGYTHREGGECTQRGLVLYPPWGCGLYHTADGDCIPGGFGSESTGGGVCPHRLSCACIHLDGGAVPPEEVGCVSTEGVVDCSHRSGGVCNPWMWDCIPRGCGLFHILW